MRNRFAFGLGTVGRDMVYSLVSMYLIFYLTDVLYVPTGVLWWITAIVLICRVFDACNDPVMGVIVDNTHSRFGKFKPWIAFGTLTSGIITVLLFTGFPLLSPGQVALFGVLYLLWGMAYTTNDIAYWSMLPSLSLEQREREKIGAIARICANIGLFFVVAGIIPITKAWSGGETISQSAFLRFAALLVIIMWIGQCITLFGVKHHGATADIIANTGGHTSLRDMLSVIIKNDQLLFTAIAMTLFMVGYVTTTSFGIYYFKYAYGNEDMYALFALVLGVSQIAALALFPLFSKYFDRKTLYAAAIVLIVAGYIIFFFAPVTTMLFIGIAGVLLFVGQAFIQLLMLMFLADSVDYGHWKLGKRNDSVTFSIQPFINKMSGALGNGVVSAVIILSGIKDAESAADVTGGAILFMKTAMMIFPLICIVVSFIIYRAKYKIDKALYDHIQAALQAQDRR